MHHLIQRRRNQPAQSDDVCIVFNRLIKDFVGSNHHTKVYDIVSIATQYNTHNIFSDIMYITFYSSKQNLSRSRGLLLGSLNEGGENSHTFFHDSGTFHHLWQEHFSNTKQISHNVHSIHQGTFNNIQWTGVRLSCLFSIRINVFSNAIDQGMFQTFFNGVVPPGFVSFLHFSFGLDGFRKLDQFFCCLVIIIVLVEDNIFAEVPERRVNLVINHQLSCIHNAHVHPSLDGMKQEHGVHGFTNMVVTTERKRKVADTTRYFDLWIFLFQYTGGLNKINPIVVVFFQACGHCKNIEIKDDIRSRESYFFGEDFESTVANLDSFFQRICLPLLVKGHHDDRCTKASANDGLLNELFFSFFEGDGVHHTFTLYAFEPRFDD